MIKHHSHFGPPYQWSGPQPKSLEESTTILAAFLLYLPIHRCPRDMTESCFELSQHPMDFILKFSCSMYISISHEPQEHVSVSVSAKTKYYDSTPCILWHKCTLKIYTSFIQIQLNLYKSHSSVNHKLKDFNAYFSVIFIAWRHKKQPV